MSKKFSSYDSKAIESGNMIEIYHYERPVIFDRPQVRRNYEKKNNKKHASSLYRARSNIRRLIMANVEEQTKFCTFTFAENITDLKVANRIWTNFVQRLNYRLKMKLKYLVVVEFQKRGAVHYHVVMFNSPYIPNKKLAEIWGQGFVRINAIDHVDHLGAYVCKYLSKELNDERLRGQKVYFTSRNLKRPDEIVYSQYVDRLQENLDLPESGYELRIQYEYDTEMNGRVFYLQYVFKSDRSVESRVKNCSEVKK